MAALWTRRDATDRELRVQFGLLPWILPFSSSPDLRASSSLSVPVAIVVVSSALSPAPTATHRRPGASSSLSVPVAIVVVSSAISPVPAAPHRRKVRDTLQANEKPCQNETPTCQTMPESNISSNRSVRHLLVFGVLDSWDVPG
ncbi:hypothetical protein ACLOJK_034700 [Asimina triloba]